MATPTPVVAPTRTITYRYDGLQRLTGATETPGTTYDYTYDLAGNRTEVRENGAPVANLSYNDANQVIGWSYDAAGNLLSDGTTTRSYDALNRLVAQAGTSYTYNGDGVLVSDGTTTYAQDLAAPLSQILSDGSATYVYGAGSERLRAVDGPWYLGDALGSVRTTLDDAGAVRATASYDPWGTPQGALLGPFGFTGELHHGDQVYLRARWYAPGWGTFTSRDPFAGWPEMPYSLHAYQYAYSAPTVWTDPSGECVFAVVDTIVCVGGVTFTIGQAIALVTAVGSATAATYDACVTQGGCRQLALDLERALESLGSSTPPLDPGPPESPVLRGAPQYVPARDDHLVSSPLTGPEEACWVIPGPLLVPPPWPFTTGAPLAPVQESEILMASGGRSLGGIDLDDYTPGTGFSGVYNTGTKHYLLRPSSNHRTDAQIAAGWVPRTGGHREVQHQLHGQGRATDYHKDVGFAVIYERRDTLVITFHSGGVNFPTFGDYYPPQDVKDEITAVISRDAPGMTIIPIDRYRKDP